MPRPKTISQSTHPYHVTARSINKEWFKIPIRDVWNIFSTQLTYVSWVFGAQIHSFVLMNNHFHLLITTPNANLSKVMAHLMKETSRAMGLKSKRINQIYGARHTRSIIKNSHHFSHAYKYIYRNPVKAGLAKKCELYPFSSLNFILGGQKVKFPIVEDSLFFESREDTLVWLNTLPNDEDWKSIGLAMVRKEFKISKNKNSNKPHYLERQSL